MKSVLKFIGDRLKPQTQAVEIIDAQSENDPTPYYVAGGVAIATLLAAYFITRK